MPHPFSLTDFMTLIPRTASISPGLLAAIMLLSPAGAARAQAPPQATRDLARDLRSAPVHRSASLLDSTLAVTGSSDGRLKSPLVAGLLSIALPGSGQVYAHAPVWRSILYGAVEVTGWTLCIVFNGKGDRTTTEFETFADTHWDVTRYVDWIARNYERWPDEEIDKKAAADALAKIYVSNDPALQPWQRVDFAQLNQLERSVRRSFSHTLPEHGEQQYYEEIGKYTQYRAGWDDHDLTGDTLIYDNSKVTARNRQYTVTRADANSYYDYATAAVGVLLLNHVVSMLDALLQTRSYNASIRAGLHGGLDPASRPYPEMTLRVGF